MTTIIARSAESVHWYRAEDGKPQYTVPAKDGSDRPTTLRDARKMNLVPSVTTVMKIAAKPGLDVWKNEQLLLAALTLPKVEGETEKEFIARVVSDSKETGKRAAERGTRIHESIERWYGVTRTSSTSRLLRLLRSLFSTTSRLTPSKIGRRKSRSLMSWVLAVRPTCLLSSPKTPLWGSFWTPRPKSLTSTTTSLHTMRTSCSWRLTVSAWGYPMHVARTSLHPLLTTV